MNQSLYNWLGNRGFTGTLDDRINQYLKFVVAGSGASDATNDLWKKYATQGAYVATTLQQIQIEWCKNQGVIGGWNDAMGNLPGFLPSDLFFQGQQGAWYDPSDMATMFQDVNGTLPVTATGQPVGLLLDKHSGLALGPEILSADAAGGPFINTGGWISTSGASTISFSNGEVVSTINNLNSNWVLRQPDISLTAGVTYKLIVNARQSGLFDGDGIRILLYNQTSPGTVATGPSAQVLNDTQLFAHYKPTVTGLYSLIIERANPQVTDNGKSVRITKASVTSVAGNHATQSSASSRPTFRDVGGLRYLEFDGVDDFLVTGNIDLSSVVALTAFAGLRKLSDSSSKSVLDFGLNPDTTPSFSMLAPAGGGTARFDFRIRGATTSVLAQTSSPTYDAPISAVVTGMGDTTTPPVKLRVNGAEVASVATPAGGGGYGINPLFIGRRGGTILPFTGNIYGLIIRGALSNEVDIYNAEQYLAAKSGIVI